MPPQQPTRERRLRRRHGLADVRGNLLFSYECRILNLSEHGLAVRATTPLAPGRSYALKVQHDGRTISLSGTVAWCRLQGTERDANGESVAVYTAGIELGGDLSARAAEILPLLHEKGVVRLERRLHGHLRPRGMVDAAAGPAAVTVRELSRAGMVAEAPFFPARGDLLDFRLELGEEALALTVRVTGARPLGEREGHPWAELTVQYAEIQPQDRERLDRLIREELGPAAAPGG